MKKSKRISFDVPRVQNKDYSSDYMLRSIHFLSFIYSYGSANGDVVAVDSGIGIYTAGPFPTGTAVSISRVGDNTDCDISSAPLLDGCPPANDDCANAIPVVCDGNYVGSTSAATDSGGNAAEDVWFSYTGNGTAEDVTLDLCPSSDDTLVGVFTDCPGTHQIAVNDDSQSVCGNTRSYLSFASDGTTT